MTVKPIRPNTPVPEGFSPHAAQERVNWFTRWFETLAGNVEFPGAIKCRGRLYTFTTVQSSFYQILITDDYLLVNRAGAVTLLLPPGSILDRGRRFIVQDDSGGAATHNITIERSGTNTINGAASTTISTNYGKTEIVWTGSQYLV